MLRLSWGVDGGRKGVCVDRVGEGCLAARRSARTTKAEGKSQVRNGTQR